MACSDFQVKAHPLFASCRLLEAKIFPEAVDLVHSLVQYCHDTYVIGRESAPVDEMPFVAKEVALDSELGRNGTRLCFACLDPIESGEQTGDVTVGLFSSPTIPRVAIDLVKPVGGRLVNEDVYLVHAINYGCV